MNIDIDALLATSCTLRESVIIRATLLGYQPSEIARRYNITSRRVQEVRDRAIRHMRRTVIRDLNPNPARARCGR